MLLDDDQAYRQAKAGTAPGTTRGEEGIKDLGTDFRRYPRAIIVNQYFQLTVQCICMNSDQPVISDGSYRLFRVRDNVDEDLRKLVRVSFDRRQVAKMFKFHGNVTVIEGLPAKINGAVNEIHHLHLLTAGTRGTRKCQQILHQSRCFPGLLMNQFSLPSE